MADVDNGDILRIGANFLLEGSYQLANVFHVRVTTGGGIDFADATDDIAEYIDDIYDGVMTYLTDEMSSYNLTLQNLTQATVAGAFAFATPLNGVASDSMLPYGVACLTWARTFKPRVASRKYWGAFTEAGLDNGLWTGSVINACVQAHEQHATAFTGSNSLTVLGVAWNRLLETYTTLQAVAAVSEPAYQRRRRRGRGS